MRSPCRGLSQKRILTMEYTTLYLVMTKLLSLTLGAGIAFLIVGLLAATLQDLEEDSLE